MCFDSLLLVCFIRCIWQTSSALHANVFEYADMTYNTMQRMNKSAAANHKRFDADIVHKSLLLLQGELALHEVVCDAPYDAEQRYAMRCIATRYITMRGKTKAFLPEG